MSWLRSRCYLRLPGRQHVGQGSVLITFRKEATGLTFLVVISCSSPPASLPFNKDGAGKRGCCKIQLAVASKA